MFNYLFPIFCFGLLKTGIVFLGIMEAAKQVKSEELKMDAIKLNEADLAASLTAGRRSSAPHSSQRQ